MTTINIAYEVPAATVAVIEAHLADTAMRNPNWNGAEFNIERDDFTSIDEDGYDATALLYEIFAIIRGE